MKTIKSLVLSRFNATGRIYRKNIKARCKDMSRRDFEHEIETLKEKGVIKAIDTITEDEECATIYVCMYDIVGTDGDIVYLKDKETNC